MAQEGLQAPAAETIADTGTDPYAAVEKLQRSLKYTVPRARAAITLERAWPRMLPAVGLTTLFMASAWSGAWSYLQPDLKMAGLGLAAVAMAACLYPLHKVRIASRAEGIARVDENTGLPHQPVESILGQPGTDKPESVALWRARQIATAEKVGEFRAGKPRVGIFADTPMILRVVPIALAALGFALGGLDGYNNLKQPFDFSVPVPPVIPARVDAWVAPPEYTRQAPTFLTVESAVRKETPSGSELVMPTGSRVIVRISGGDGNVTVTGGAVIEKQPDAIPVLDPATATPQQLAVAEARRKAPREYTVVLKDDAKIAITAQGGVALNWAFDVTGDTAPEVSVEAKPNEARPGAIDLDYTVKDDYGAVTVQTEIQNGEEPKTTSRRKPRPLVNAPTINLPIPRNN